MKTIKILLILLLISSFCNAQDMRSLFKDIIKPREYCTIILSTRRKTAFYSKPDSLEALQVKYFCGHNKSVADGRYLVWEMDVQDIYAGVSFSYMWHLTEKSRPRTYTAYLKNGVPDGMWGYVYGDHDTVDSKTICKRELFKDGLLDGEFIFYNATDTLYRTTFVMGTGRYREYFSDGRLMFEGNLINGYRDGIWCYYKYENDSITAPYRVYIHKYKQGKLESEDLYFHSKQVDKIVAWERSVPNRKKKKYSNPFNTYIEAQNWDKYPTSLR